MVDIALVKAARYLAAATALVLLTVACGGGDRPAAEEQRSDVKERNVSFETRDGRTLTGRLFGSGRVGVALAHMYPSDATSWYEPAREIAEAGYLTLAFNFRGYGNSKGTKNVTRAPIDFEAAAEFLGQEGAKDYAYVGASMGGTAALVAAQAQNPLAIVTLSAPLRFMGLDAAVIAVRVQRPVLLMASQDDSPAMAAVDDLERALPNADTKIYAGPAHGSELLNARPEAVDEIVTFLERYAPLAVPTITGAE